MLEPGVTSGVLVVVASICQSIRTEILTLLCNTFLLFFHVLSSFFMFRCLEVNLHVSYYFTTCFILTLC